MGSSSLGMQENPSSSGTAKQHMPFQQAGAQAVHCFSGRQYILDHMRTRFDSGFTQSRRSCTSIPRGSIHHTMDSSGKSLAEAISCRTNCLTNPVLKKKKKSISIALVVFSDFYQLYLIHTRKKNVRSGTKSNKSKPCAPIIGHGLIHLVIPRL